jgi:hypothetical protein
MAGRSPSGVDYSQADEDLAEWLVSQNLAGAPARVRGWRRAGLLPEPEDTSPRLAGQPGRLAARWSSSQLPHARALAVALMTATGRGKSNAHAALRLAGAGLPVPADTVLAAARAEVARMQQAGQHLLGAELGSMLRATDPEGQLDHIDAYVQGHPGLVRLISQQLGNPPKRDGEPDAMGVLSLLLQATLGAPLEAADVPTLELTLQAMSLQGLVEAVGGPGGARVLSGGAADAIPALDMLNLSRLSSLIDDIDADTVHATLQATRQVGLVFAAAPPQLRHHLGADVLAPALMDDDPVWVVFRLAVFQAVRRDRGSEPDVSPIIGSAVDTTEKQNSSLY